MTNAASTSVASNNVDQTSDTPAGVDQVDSLVDADWMRTGHRRRMVGVQLYSNTCLFSGVVYF